MSVVPEAPEEVLLRPMRWWDIETLLGLERTLFGAEAWSAETFWGELAAPGRRYLIAQPLAEASAGAGGPVPLGYGGVAVGRADADIMTVAVAPEAQGRGLGARLLEALVALAVEGGAGSVLLEVRADNEPARRLYERYGFNQIGVRRGYYSAGQVDALVLRRRGVGHESPQ